MTMAALEERRDELTGRRLTTSEARLIRSRLQFRAEWLLDLLQHYALGGMEFALPAAEDSSGLGVDLKWKTPDGMIRETLEFYPGIAAAPLGYVAVGSCMSGFGDPYFVKVTTGEDPPLVRIPHDRLEKDRSLSESVIEVVRSELSDFFRVAHFGERRGQSQEKGS